jgi:predicted glycosyltransferase
MEMLRTRLGLRPVRVALYSHDTVGLGHIRRNLLIARIIAGSSLPTSILLICGTREVAAFSLPSWTDCLALPSLTKDPEGTYQPRCLAVSLDDLVAVRAKTIAAALDTFAPDVLIVDKVPRGALRELESALELLRRRGDAVCVLGLRDILDDEATVRREWSGEAMADAVREYYDAVWVYGDPAVFDQVRAYDYPADVAAKVRYTGYVSRPARVTFSEIDGAELLPLQLGPPERLYVCMVGGGQDGLPLAEAFAQVDFPAHTKGVIVTGPFMPPEALEGLYRLAAGRPRLRVLKFVTDPDLLLSLADRVVAMGGYNTVCELLSFQKRALIVPRVHPRLEQFIRARRLRDLGLIDMLLPHELSPGALGKWLGRAGGPPVRVHERIDLNGAANVPRLLEKVLTESPRRARRLERRVQYVT